MDTKAEQLTKSELSFLRQMLAAQMASLSDRVENGSSFSGMFRGQIDAMSRIDKRIESIIDGM